MSEVSIIYSKHCGNQIHVKGKPGYIGLPSDFIDAIQELIDFKAEHVCCHKDGWPTEPPKNPVEVKFSDLLAGEYYWWHSEWLECHKTSEEEPILVGCKGVVVTKNIECLTLTVDGPQLTVGDLKTGQFGTTENYLVLRTENYNNEKSKFVCWSLEKDGTPGWDKQYDMFVCRISEPQGNLLPYPCELVEVVVK